MERKGSFLKNIVGFSWVTWITFIVGFIAAPISTRLFNPSEVGKINLFNTYSTLISTFVLLGLDQVYVRFYDEKLKEKKDKTLLGFCLNVSFIATTVIGVALLFFNDVVSYEILGTSTSFAAVFIIIYSFASVGTRYINLDYRMTQDIKWYTIQGVLYAVFNKVAYLAVAFWSADAQTAILALVVSNFIFMIIFLYVRRSHMNFKAFKFVDKESVIGMSKYALPLIPVSLLAWANNSISNIVLRQLLGFSTIGIYSTAVNLSGAVNLIQAGFNVYWAPYVYKNYQNEENKNFWTIHKLISCCLTLFAILIILFQPVIFMLIGEKYRSGMLFFPLLMLTPVCYTIAETTGLGINISKKTYWNLVIFSLTIIVNIVLSYILIPVLGVSGAAFAAAIVAVLSLILRTFIGDRYYRSIKNYSYIVKSISLVVLAATLNYLLYDFNMIKNLALFSVLIVSLLIFKDEVIFLFKTTKVIIISMKNKGQEDR